MKVSLLSVEVVLDTRRAKANGAFPIKLRLTYQRIQQYYKLKLEATQLFWNEVQAGRRAKSHNDLREAIASVEAKANVVIRSFEKQDVAFDFDLFEKAFFGEALDSVRERERAQDVYLALGAYVGQLRAEEQVGTAASYNNALQSFQKYQPRLTFREITPGWLRQYEKAMLTNGKSVSTVGIYLRALRIVINQAIEQGTITQGEYPFGKKRYQIPASKNIKKALQLADIRAIRNYPTKPGSDEDRNRDLWVFSYLCNGMNPKDIFRLTWGDVDGDIIRFNRKKTQRATRANPRRIDVVMSEPVQAIIAKWGNPDHSPDALLFPFFAQNLTAQAWDTRARDLIKQINKYMKRIGESLHIAIPVTTYVARHSYATVMKRSGASNELIGESMGHSSLKSTENYMDSFGDDVKRDFASVLL